MSCRTETPAQAPAYAPTLESVTPGDAELSLSWSRGANVEADLDHYQLYCEPADFPDPKLCASSTLSLPSTSPRGEAGHSATRGNAEGLDNGVRYACGVAGVDSFANLGPLSNLVCAAPKASPPAELTGRCQFGRGPITPGTSVAILTLLGCLAWRRARARGRRVARDPS